MKKQVKVLACALSASLFTGALAGCNGKVNNTSSNSSAGAALVSAAEKNTNFNATGDKIVKQKQKFTVWIQQVSTLKAANDKEAVKKTEEKTNVQIDFVEIPTSSWTEKCNVTLASNDLPDAFNGEMDDISNYVSKFQKLNALIDKYAPTTKNLINKYYPEYRASLADQNGNIIGLPMGDVYAGNSVSQVLWINQDFLKKLNLTMPTTTTEFENYLKAVKTQDPNGNGQADEIPLSFLNIWDFSTGGGNLFGSFGAPESAQHVFVDPKTKKVKLAAQQDGYYQALKWLHELWSQGLIWNGAFTGSSDTYKLNAGGKEVSGSYIGFSDSAQGNTTLGSTWFDSTSTSHIYKSVAPLKGSSGTQMVFQTNLAKKPGFLITTSCKNPEVLVRWYDWVNTGLENYTLWRDGPEGIAWDWGTLTDQNASDYKKQTGLSISQGPDALKVGDKTPSLHLIDTATAKKYNYSDANTLLAAENFGGQSPALSYPEKSNELNNEDKRYDTRLNATNQYLPYAVQGVPQGMTSKENAQDRANILADLDTYLKRFISDSVINGIDDAKWKEHLQKLKQLNADEYVKLCQEATDQINAKIGSSSTQSK